MTRAGADWLCSHSSFIVHHSSFLSMPSYRYETSGAGGKVNTGIVQAADLAAASQQLRARNEFIIPLVPAESIGPKGAINLSFSFGPGAKDVQNFTSQLAVMIRAGISIRAAIEGISDQVENPNFKKMLVQMKRDAESGKQFSVDLMCYLKVFSPLFLRLARK